MPMRIMTVTANSSDIINEIRITCAVKVLVQYAQGRGERSTLQNDKMKKTNPYFKKQSPGHGSLVRTQNSFVLSEGYSIAFVVV